MCALFTPARAKPLRDTASRCEKVRAWISRTHTPRPEEDRRLSFFTRWRIGAPRALRRQGKVARAICPRPDCGSVEKKKERKEKRAGVRERETYKNQTPKALPSWHASTSQPLSLNRITSRGLRRDFSLFSFAAHRGLFCFFSLHPSTLFKDHAREVALFLKLVLLLLFGSTCRHHRCVFIPRMPCTTLGTHDPAKEHSRITDENANAAIANLYDTLHNGSIYWSIDLRDRHRS